MNRKLLQSVREYKKESILAPILVALEVLMEVLIPLMMAKIIDVGMVQGDMGYIVKVGLMLVVMAMLALFFGAKAGQLAAVAAAGYAKNLRHDIFYKIQDFSFGNIDHFSTSSLVTRLTTDITNVQMAYMFTIRLLARAPIMIVLSLDDDSDDQYRNCIVAADYDSCVGRAFDLYCEEGSSAFHRGF